MSAFDKVIGYEAIKNELKQICDMIHNKEFYDSVGAKLPKGLLLIGNPGLGKTLMVKCFIKETGLKAYTVRRTKSEEFCEEITKVFQEAKANAPCIILLDDMDKFANEDNIHKDAEEYVAIQSGIDDVKDVDVFVIGTVNNAWKLPDSLTRAGRFDRKIKVMRPSGKDAELIVKHYLKDKIIDESVNMDDIVKMISYESCAELETVINEAAICAASNRRTKIMMEDLLKVILRIEYSTSDDYATINPEVLEGSAIHEAGHIVACEVLQPGSVGFASIRSRGRGDRGGFVHRCMDYESDNYHVVVSLAGKLATDLFCKETILGAGEDLARACNYIEGIVTGQALNGLESFEWKREHSEPHYERVESIVRSSVEEYMDKTRKLLILNEDFLRKLAAELMEKKVLLHSDIRRIRESVDIVTLRDFKAA